MRSVALNASSSSGVIREVSPTTRPGNSARASGSSPSVAARSPPRSLPRTAAWPTAARPPAAAPLPRTRNTAAIRSPPPSGGTTRAVTRTRVDGRRESQGEPCPAPVRPPRAPASTISSTGVSGLRHRPVRLLDPSDLGVEQDGGREPRDPGDPGSGSRGSEVTSTSAVTWAYWRASAGTGPRCRSAPCRPAEARRRHAQSSTAATERATKPSPRRRAALLAPPRPGGCGSAPVRPYGVGPVPWRRPSPARRTARGSPFGAA